MNLNLGDIEEMRFKWKKSQSVKCDLHVKKNSMKGK